MATKDETFFTLFPFYDSSKASIKILTLKMIKERIIRAKGIAKGHKSSKSLSQRMCV